MDNLVDFLQNEPIALVLVAAIAVITLFVFIFPLLINSIPVLSNKETKEKHRRPIFLITIFVLLSLVAGAILLVPGIREKFFKPKATAEYTLYGDIVKIEENLVTIRQVTTEFQYGVKVTSSTKIAELESKKKLSLDSMRKGQTIEVVSSQAPSTKTTISAIKINVYSERPTSKSIPSFGD